MAQSNHIRAISLAFGLVLALSFNPSAAVATAGSLCAYHASVTERSESIPRHLLSALSVVETGRWDPERGETIAWPWTVTAEGKGHFLPSKTAAIEKVKELRAAGVNSIDVGCMQVNLYYHSDAFADLDSSFDPAQNMAYAANFLKQLYEQTQSWTQAAGHYHSRTPRYRDRYKRKVIQAWREANDRKQVASWTPPKELDETRFRRLNEAFKERRAAERELGGEIRRAAQLRSWRAVKNSGDLSAIYARQEAQRMRRLKEQIQLPTRQRSEAEFAASRARQLAEWRRRQPL